MISGAFNRFISLLTGLFFIVISAHCQFVNSGELHIKDGTVLYSAFPFENRSSGKVINNGTVVFLSDLVNEGEFAYSSTETTGIVRLEGLSTQNISGSSQLKFWNLILNNSNDFNLSNDLEVSGVADFGSGIVKAALPENVFSFGTDGSSINSNDKSFVDGKVGVQTKREILFPTGDEIYQRILLASPIQPNEQLSLRGRYFLEDPGNLYPRDQTAPNIILVDDAEYWELENLDDEDSEMNLTLSWREVTTPPFILGDINKLGIVRWDQNQNIWVSEGGVIDFNEQLVTAEVSLNGAAVYTLGIFTGFTNLGLNKTSFDVSIWEGDQFDYQITLQNNSQVAATDVVLIDNLPNQLEFVSIKGESIFGLIEFDVEVVGQSVIIRIPEFIGGDEATFILTVRAADPGRIVNLAEVNSLEPDEDPSDNLDTDENEVKTFFIPNTFTPNSDGFNDQFEIKGLNKFVSNKIIIFNRYGDIIFETDDYKNDWKAAGLSAGTYFYILNVVEEDGSDQSFKGWIQVIRENGFKDDL